MQLNKNQIVEINLKDLFFHILYRWRSILLVAITGAIALGTYQYFTIKGAHDAGKLTKDERQYQLDLQNYKEDLEGYRAQITVLTNRLEGQRRYQAKSVYIRLDAQNVWTAQNKYVVKVDQSVLDALPTGSSIDPADIILPAYTTALSGDLDEQALKDAFNTDEAEYVKELVSIDANTADNSIVVIVQGSTKEVAEKGLAYVNQLITEVSKGKAQEINAHQLLDLGETTSLGDNEILAKKQADLISTIASDQKSLQEARKNLDALETKKEPSEPGDHVKSMAAIGFVVGAFLLVFAYSVLFICRGRLNNSRDMALRYKLPVFGEFATSGQIHSNKGLDKLISKWELGKESLDEETVFDNIAALIKKRQDAQRILLITTIPQEKLTVIKEALANRLPDRKIGIQADALRNSDAITEAAKADVVIITEKKGVSRLKDMDRMAETLIISEANVIGAIVL